MNTESKLLVNLFSDANFLAVNVLENLLAKNCLVYVVSSDIKKWKEKTKHISINNHFKFVSFDDYKKISNFSYAIFIGGFLKKENSYSDFKKFLSNKNFGVAKTLAIFSSESWNLKTDSQINVSENAGIVYVGDVLGPRIDLESNLLIPSLINEMIINRTLTLGVGEIFYPLFVSDVAKTIVKWLLSFGPYGTKTLLVGDSVSSTDFWKQNTKSIPDLKIRYDTSISTRAVPKIYESKTISSSLSFCLNETYSWVLEKRSEYPTVKSPRKNIKFLRIKKSPKLKFLRPYAILTLLLLFFPFLTIIFSSALLLFSYKNFVSGKYESAQKISLLAKTIYSIGESESNVLGYVPGVGLVYKETSFASNIGISACDILFSVYPAMDAGQKLSDGILDNSVYDPVPPLNLIKSELDFVYKELVLLKAVTNESSNKNVFIAHKLLQVFDFDKFINISKQGSVIASNTSSILGNDSSKNYLILFQNNMELRPTGGFIGSYGIASFGGGKMNGLTVNDIYSADGQLRGHIEPPTPIRDYLGEANWWFRDSNWDPDFPTSAQRAEWFLNKEMSQQVDGVVAIDLEPIKEILKYTGPIFLPDYNLTITSDNLYEKTQQEAQANFFPGSRQKASFLTALSRSLLVEVGKARTSSKFQILKSFYNSLESRHIQIYLHNLDAQAALDNVLWSGKIPTYTCGQNCYSDFFGDIEANVGVNKANYFIKRSMVFDTKIDESQITRRLVVNLKNSANLSLGPSGRYKTYLRIMVPLDSHVMDVSSFSGQSKLKLQPEIVQEKGYLSVGVLVEVAPNEEKKVALMWSGDLPAGAKYTSYGLFVRKQSGVGDDDLSVRVESSNPKIITQPTFSLTNDGVYTYNTVLSKDLFVRLNWK